MNWSGEPCVVMASGPSLGWDDYADVKLIESLGIKTIAVNSTWEVARFCDVIYAGDNNWWRLNHKKIDIPAARWTCAKSAMRVFGASYRDRKITPGYNSGANAVELAANEFGATPIIMLGFDGSIKHGVHHHGNHQGTHNPTEARCIKWQEQFASLRERTKGIEIVNCSRFSVLDHFERQDLREFLCGRGWL